MANFTIQTLFLLYSALSLSAAILIGALFWRKNDYSAKLWMYGCLLTSIGTAVTVYRGDIPLMISYSLMISIEALSILLFSQSLKKLSPSKAHLPVDKLVWIAPPALFIVVELDRHFSRGALTPTMTALASFTFGLSNLYCFKQSRDVGKEFTNRLFLNFLAVAFIGMASLYFIRVANVLIGYSGSAFDIKSFNLFIWLFIALLGSIRNLTYIVLRLHLGFAEHGRLNNMNLRLANVIDERNDMILSLERLNKSASINALASTIAHEINQPLGASKLNAEFINLKLSSDPENIALLKEVNQHILDDLKRASGIVGNLSRLSLKNKDHITSVNLAESIQEVMEISKGKLRASHIDLELVCHPKQMIQINLGEWQQVVINLINNAVESLESTDRGNKKILIKVELKNKIVSILFEDNGPGIQEAEKEKIFELMVSHKSSGTGIGLWLSQNIITRHGGNIFAGNKVDGGARFTVTLPAG